MRRNAKNAAYVSPAFQELNNRVPKVKAKKKQWNTQKLLPGLTGDKMLEVFRKDCEDKIRIAEEKKCKRIKHEEKRKQREEEKGRH